jgi:ketosteroid isomerase-like protein
MPVPFTCVGRASSLGGAASFDYEIRITASGQTAMPREPTVATLKAILDAFNAHDLDRIMGFFADDCVLEMPRGHEKCGARSVGRAAVRAGLAARFAGLPDVHYGEDSHFVAGDIGVSQWTVTGTTAQGERIEVRGCDFFTFRDGKVVKKDSYWKIREPK